MGLGLHQSSISSSLLWPKLYFCLSCGDASFALQIFKFSKSNESEQSNLLSLLEPINPIMENPVYGIYPKQTIIIILIILIPPSHQRFPLVSIYH